MHPFNKLISKSSQKLSAAIILILSLAHITVGLQYKGTEYKFSERQEFSRAYIQEFYDSQDDLCHSWVQLPGFYVSSAAVLFLAYSLTLFYLFLGIAIISDVFMACIQVITSKTKKVQVRNQEGVLISKEITFWNPTIANLTLMALGSSAPQILLSIIETVTTLGKAPGKLGPSTIVGSAAFNFLVISGVSVAAVSSPGVKKVADLGVFTITSVSSLFAYIWMYIVLKLWTEDEVTIEEAIITFVFFFILIGSAYGCDKCNQKSRKKNRVKKDSLDPSTSQGLEGGKKARNSNATLKAFDLMVNSQRKGKLRKSLRPQDTRSTSQYLQKLLGKQDLNTVRQDDVNRFIQAESVADSILPRIKYRKSIGISNQNKAPIVILKGKKQENAIDLNISYQQGSNPKFCFGSAHYKCKQSDGQISIFIYKKNENSTGKVGVRTIEGTANAHTDFVPLNQIIQFSELQSQKKITIEIIDQNQWEPDQDFFVELYDAETKNTLSGDDVKCTVTIIDDDNPGVIGFDKAFIQASQAHKYVKLTILRAEGSDGVVSCKYAAQEIKENSAAAKEGEDFVESKGQIVFQHSQTQKVIKIQLVQKQDSQRDDIFRVRIFQPQGGASLSKKDACMVQIVHDDEMLKALEKIQNAVQLAQETKNPSYSDQFKNAIIFSSHVDQDGNVIKPSCCESALHFMSIGWKLLFALVPPPKACGGWLAFVISLVFIGIITAIVAEFANLFGCVIGLKPEVTAITFVALGTSLPDTFASMQAAKQSDSADSAIGNVTGSNSVNVFLGLGLPWLIASIYYKVTDDIGYKVPAGGLDFSVMLFLICCVVGLFILIIRRKCVGGELGGTSGCKILSALMMVLLWIIYVVLSSLRVYDNI